MELPSLREHIFNKDIQRKSKAKAKFFFAIPCKVIKVIKANYDFEGLSQLSQDL